MAEEVKTTAEEAKATAEEAKNQPPHADTKEQEPVKSENRISETDQFLLNVARTARADGAVMDLLNQTGDKYTKMWLVICLLDGMKPEEMLELTGRGTEEIRRARDESLRRRYQASDPLYQDVQNLKKEVASELQESRDIRKSIEKGLDHALKQQADIQKELIRSKDEIIKTLRRQLKDAEQEQERTQSVYEMRLKLLREEKEKGSAGEPDGRPEREAAPSVREIPPEEKSKAPEAASSDTMKERMHGFFLAMRKKSSVQTFLNQIVENEKLSKEQKDFLLQCLENGESVKTIRQIASSSLTVEQMGRLLNYYRTKTGEAKNKW